MQKAQAWYTDKTSNLGKWNQPLVAPLSAAEGQPAPGDVQLGAGASTMWSPRKGVAQKGRWHRAEKPMEMSPLKCFLGFSSISLCAHPDNVPKRWVFAPGLVNSP